MHIDSYDFGKIVIDGTSYSSDVIIYPDRVDTGWWREEGHSLSLKDVQSIIEYEPEVLIIGTGSYGAMHIPKETREHIESKGIRLIVNTTGEATESFNQTKKSGKVVGAFHLTC